MSLIMRGRSLVPEVVMVNVFAAVDWMLRSVSRQPGAIRRRQIRRNEALSFVRNLGLHVFYAQGRVRKYYFFLEKKERGYAFESGESRENTDA